MLLIDGEKIEPQKFCDRFGIDLSKIKSNPVFELAPKYRKVDNANGGVIKIPARISFPTTFFAKDSEGATVEVKYAEGSNKRNVGGEIVSTYYPRYIYFEAAVNSFKKDLDKALFIAANPKNRFSKLRSGIVKDYDYEHVDNVKRAKSKLTNLGNVAKAMGHAETLTAEELNIFAKGLMATFKNFNPFIHGVDTDEDTLRAQVLEFAHVNSNGYLEAVGDSTANLKGRIINLIDKGVIGQKSYNSGLSIQWEWKSGERIGQAIGEVITGANNDPREYLVNYLLNNLPEYYGALHTINDSLSATEKAKQFMASIKKEEVHAQAPSVEGLPNGYKECQEWLGENGYKKTPKIAKQLEEGIKDGDVNRENIRGFVDNLFTIEESER